MPRLVFMSFHETCRLRTGKEELVGSCNDEVLPLKTLGDLILTI